MEAERTDRAVQSLSRARAAKSAKQRGNESFANVFPSVLLVQLRSIDLN